MNKASLRVSELAIGLILFEVGSTPLFLLGSTAKQDAWISMSIGAFFGLLLLLMYLGIHRKEPEWDLFELCRKYWGRYLGPLAGLAFVCYFAYETSRNLRDLGELTVLTLLIRTPILIILLITILVIANSVFHRIEVLFWTSMAMFPVMVVSYLLIIGFISGAGLIHPEFMFPVLDNGWKPVWDSAFPEIISFPFGQTVLYLVFFPMAAKKLELPKAIIVSYACVALFLIILNQINILVLGPILSANTTFPLLQIVQLIRLARVFERIDIVFSLLLFLGLGIKMTAFYAAAAIGMEKITGISYKKWVLPLGAAIFGASLMSPDYTHHIWTGLVVVVNRVSPIFQILLPVLLYATILIRQKKWRSPPS